MSKVEVTNVKEEESINFPGGNRARFLSEGEDFVLAVCFMDPGDGETWHTHKEDMEEIYYTLAGKGEIKWKEDGEVKSEILEPGDSALLEKGLENKIESVGTETWVVIAILSDVGEGDFSERFRD